MEILSFVKWEMWATDLPEDPHNRDSAASFKHITQAPLLSSASRMIEVQASTV